LPYVGRAWGMGMGLAPWAHAASAIITKSATDHLRQFIASSGPPNPAGLTHASDGLDQARVIVLDVADASADGPARHFFRWGWLNGLFDHSSASASRVYAVASAQETSTPAVTGTPAPRRKR
jgi:hypothetical protein